MKGMNTQERYDDICKRSGLSEHIVRRVLAAERDSIIESLKRGERATMMGRCTFVPEIKTSVGIGCQEIKYIKVKASASSALCNELSQYSSFSNEDEADFPEDGIKLSQIGALI